MLSLKSMMRLALNIYFFAAISLNAQVIQTQQDSVLVMTPQKSKKKLSKERFNFRSFFRDKSLQASPNPRGYKKLTVQNYNSFQGKIIRKIVIKTLDPFDYNLEGESEEKINFLLKIGNAAHIKTREQTIRNFLLFSENQPFDSLKIKESERLIRIQKYTREVTMVINPIAAQSDSVDILIYELDRWSILPSYSTSNIRREATLLETNFLGTGNEFSSTYNRYRADGDHNFYASYFLPNIHGTYINGFIKLGMDENKNRIQSLVLDRPFFSPLTIWAGGINLTKFYRTNARYANDSLFELSTYSTNSQDFWVGRSFRVHQVGHPNEQNTRLIAAARFLNVAYPQKAVESFDSLGIFENEQFYLGTIGITKRKFLRDKFIYDYGVTEDVPIGSLFSFTGGYQVKNHIGRYYLGTRFSYGNYFTFGYLRANFEYGTFVNSMRSEQAAFNFDINYFTGLIKMGTWSFRQFIKTQTTIGFNRFVYEQLTFNDFYTPSVYNNFNLFGSSKVLLSFQSQFYAPYKFFGFRFAPFMRYSLGMIGQQETSFFSNRFYSQLGVGILINNLNLVFNTFQVSIAFYPQLPDKSRNVVGINPFNASDFGFGNFEVGKPSTIQFE